MKKKIIAMIFATLLICGLFAGCSSNDDMDMTPLADELFITPFTIFLYNTDDETSVSVIKKTYINTGLSKYVEDLIQYTQWCRENGYNVDDYEIITEIEKNLKTSLK